MTRCAYRAGSGSGYNVTIRERNAGHDVQQGHPESTLGLCGWRRSGSIIFRIAGLTSITLVEPFREIYKIFEISVGCFRGLRLPSGDMAPKSICRLYQGDLIKFEHIVLVDIPFGNEDGHRLKKAAHLHDCQVTRLVVFLDGEQRCRH